MLLDSAGDRLDARELAGRIRSGDWPVDPDWTQEDGRGLIEVLMGNPELAGRLPGLVVLGALVHAGCRPQLARDDRGAGASAAAKLFLETLPETVDAAEGRRLWVACMVLEVCRTAGNVIDSTKLCGGLVESVGGWGGAIQGMDMAAWIGLQASGLGRGRGLDLGGHGTEGEKKRACAILRRVLARDRDRPGRSALDDWQVKRAMDLQGAPFTTGPAGEHDWRAGEGDLADLGEVLDDAAGHGKPWITQKTALQVLVALATATRTTSQARYDLMARCFGVLETTPGGLEYAGALRVVGGMLWDGDHVVDQLPRSRAMGNAVAGCMRTRKYDMNWGLAAESLKQWMGDDPGARDGVREAITSMLANPPDHDEKVVAWRHLALELGCAPARGAGRAHRL